MMKMILRSSAHKKHYDYKRGYFHCYSTAMHLFTLLVPRFCRQGLSIVQQTGSNELLVAQHDAARYNIRLFPLPFDASEKSTNESRDDDNNDDDEWTCLPNQPSSLSDSSPPNQRNQQPQEDQRIVKAKRQ
mgnify:CR=1 FL=1